MNEPTPLAAKASLLSQTTVGLSQFAGTEGDGAYPEESTGSAIFAHRNLSNPSLHDARTFITM